MNYGSQVAVPDNYPMTPNAATTGIGIYNAGTGISIYGAGTGIGASIAANGSSGGHENVQPTVFVPYIVCLSG
jgi:microcystin-dependent protein